MQQRGIVVLVLRVGEPVEPAPVPSEHAPRLHGVLRRAGRRGHRGGVRDRAYAHGEYARRARVGHDRRPREPVDEPRRHLPRELEAQRLHEVVTVALQQVVRVAVEVVVHLPDQVRNLPWVHLRGPDVHFLPEDRRSGSRLRGRLEDTARGVVMPAERELPPVHHQAAVEYADSERARVLIHLAQVVHVDHHRNLRHRVSLPTQPPARSTARSSD